MQEQNKQTQSELIRLTSSSETILDPDEEQTILPLHEQKEESKEEKEVIKISEDVAKYVEIQSNRVVAFIINWIKSSFTKDLYIWLKTEFKQELLKELKR